jgi:GNAT superfamily N-acetyltransferase
MTISVRLLTDRDVHDYAGLRREMLREAPGSFSANPATDVGCDPDRLRQRLAEPGQAILGAFDPAGTLVGAAGLVREANPKMSHRAFIWGVYVTASARRRGVADALISGALDHARTWAGLAWVGLTVTDRSIGARALYERQGFVAWGTEPDALRINGEPVAETHMRCVL